MPYITTANKSEPESDFDFLIGERVVQNRYGSGSVTDVIYDGNGDVTIELVSE